jgi:hypothetical protein
MLNALAAYQRKPLITYGELSLLMKDENALLATREVSSSHGDPIQVTGRGIRLRRFGNGNGHLFFESDALNDINRALAEYYGEVLADCSDDDEPHVRQSTEVAKDLQYYPTPREVVERIIDGLSNLKGQKILEPSSGCGRFLDALRKAGADVLGIEVNPERAQQCRDRGHKVLTANFLETVPTADFDRVIMNPPFYGKHYAKHVRHALKFLKPGGTLTAILPITARYDHGLLDDLTGNRARWSQPWNDLPVGSFRESGTNINTTVLTVCA